MSSLAQRQDGPPPPHPPRAQVLDRTPSGQKASRPPSPLPIPASARSPPIRLRRRGIPALKGWRLSGARPLRTTALVVNPLSGTLARLEDPVGALRQAMAAVPGWSSWSSLAPISFPTRSASWRWTPTRTSS